eukprot:UN25683
MLDLINLCRDGAHCLNFRSSACDFIHPRLNTCLPFLRYGCCKRVGCPFSHDRGDYEEVPEIRKKKLNCLMTIEKNVEKEGTRNERIEHENLTIK